MKSEAGKSEGRESRRGKGQEQKGTAPRRATKRRWPKRASRGESKGKEEPVTTPVTTPGTTPIETTRRNRKKGEDVEKKGGCGKRWACKKKGRDAEKIRVPNSWICNEARLRVSACER